MRKLLYLIFFCGLFFSACTSSKQEATLVGKIDNPISDIVTISYWTLENDKWRHIEDTCSIIDGKFSFDLHINDLTKADLIFNTFHAISIYIEPKQMELSLSAKNLFDYKLTGTDSEKEYQPLKQQIASLEDSLRVLVYDKIEPLVRQLEKNPNEENFKVFQEEREKLDPIRLLLNNKLEKINIEYIKNQPNSFIAAGQLLYIIKRAEVYDSPTDSAKLLYNELSAKVKKSQLGLLALKQIQDIDDEKALKETTNIGQKAVDFSTYSLISGDTVRLSDYRGKSYVLLDFWGSWCRPCLQGIPFLKEIHKKYNKKGLTIIGIASESKKEPYLDAVEKHNLKDWPQILDVQNLEESAKGNTNKEDVKNKYYIDSFPTYLLIDQNGIIIGKWKGTSEENDKEISAMLEKLLLKK